MPKNTNAKSISFKIWYVMAKTITILLILILLANMTILRNVKNDFIFDQLKKAATAKRNIDHSLEVIRDEESLWVAHFRIDKHEDSFSLKVDQFTNALYMHNNSHDQVIERIVAHITKQDSSKDKGILKDRELWHYYYVDWDTRGTSAMVFLTSSNRKTGFPVEISVIILFLLIVSFFASRIAAKKISKPIEELEVFAEEISRRNFRASVPKTDSDEIGHLAQVLDNMRDSLKIADERDRDFLQSTSHDLKTPVMIIKGYAQAMLDGVTIDSEISAAKVIQTEADRLERKITQLLKLNTLGHALSYAENREIVRVDRIITSLVSKFSVLRPDLHFETNLKALEITGDPEALLIAFENIIENELRYAKSLMRISMHVEDKIEIIFFNDGPPFEAKDPAEFFDAYRKDKQGKFGLGLTIVKRVIEAHAGTVIAYNTPSGVEFKVTFTNSIEI